MYNVGCTYVFQMCPCRCAVHAYGIWRPCQPYHAHYYAMLTCAFCVSLNQLLRFLWWCCKPHAQRTAKTFVSLTQPRWRDLLGCVACTLFVGPPSIFLCTDVLKVCYTTEWNSILTNHTFLSPHHFSLLPMHFHYFALLFTTLQTKLSKFHSFSLLFNLLWRTSVTLSYHVATLVTGQENPSTAQRMVLDTGPVTELTQVVIDLSVCVSMQRRQTNKKTVESAVNSRWSSQWQHPHIECGNLAGVIDQSRVQYGPDAFTPVWTQRPWSIELPAPYPTRAGKQIFGTASRLFRHGSDVADVRDSKWRVQLEYTIICRSVYIGMMMISMISR